MSTLEKISRNLEVKQAITVPSTAPAPPMTSASALPAAPRSQAARMSGVLMSLAPPTAGPSSNPPSRPRSPDYAPPRGPPGVTAPQFDLSSVGFPEGPSSLTINESAVPSLDSSRIYRNELYGSDDRMTAHPAPAPAPRAPLSRRVPPLAPTFPHLGDLLHAALTPADARAIPSEALVARLATAPAPAGAPPLASLPPALQEAALVDDLLWCFTPMEGKYIRPRKHPSGGLAFDLPANDAGALPDPSLHELLQRILPTCEHATLVTRYAETRASARFGPVCQALSAGLRALLAEWRGLVAQLEGQQRAGALTLQSLWFHLQPSAASLRLVAALCAEAAHRSLRGAPLLNLLQQREAGLSGSPAARALVARLSAAAAAPLLRGIERWATEGRLEDPSNEGLVIENHALTRDSVRSDPHSDYWGLRFTLAPEVPAALAPVAADLLDAGRCLHVIRECGRDPSTLASSSSSASSSASSAARPGSLLLRAQGRALLDLASSWRRAASDQLVALVREEMRLLDRLRALRALFLCAQGDWLLQLMDVGESELTKPLPLVHRDRLQGLLDLSIKGSSAGSDPFIDDGVSLLLEREGLVQAVLAAEDPAVHRQLTQRLQLSGGGGGGAASAPLGLQALSLDVEVPWPVALVITRRSLDRYRVLFRFVFRLRHLERALTAAWLRIRGLRRHTAATAPAASLASLPALSSLCQQMVHVIKSLLQYLAESAFEPTWRVLEEHVRAPTTSIAALAEAQAACLEAMLRDCFLCKARGGLLGSLLEALEVAGQFATHVLSSPDAQLAMGIAPNAAGAAGPFARALRGLMHGLVQEGARDVKLLDLVEKLDFNDFYGLLSRRAGDWGSGRGASAGAGQMPPQARGREL